MPGMIVEVRAGESVPVDGTVLSGRSTMDLSLLTGESRPAPVAEGDPVHAGTVNLSSPLRVDVRAAGENTRVGRLMRMVEEASQRRAPVVRLADRISAWFVAAVLALAGLALVVWWSVSPAQAVDHAIALLIVTCPCALGLATPLAVSAAIGRAGKRGILIKGGDALERLARPGRVLLDKTGTLTEGRTALVRWEGDEAVKPLVAAVESGVSHPVARALAGLLGDEEPPPAEAVERASAGVAGRVEGRAVMVGSAAWIEERLGPLDDAWAGRVTAMAERRTDAGAGGGGRVRSAPSPDWATRCERTRRQPSPACALRAGAWVCSRAITRWWRRRWVATWASTRTIVSAEPRPSRSCGRWSGPRARARW